MAKLRSLLKCTVQQQPLGCKVPNSMRCSGMSSGCTTLVSGRLHLPTLSYSRFFIIPGSQAVGSTLYLGLSPSGGCI